MRCAGPARRAGLEEVVQRSASVEAARSGLYLGDEDRDDDGALAQQERAHGPLNAGRCGFLCEPQSDVPQRGGHCCDVVMPSSHSLLRFYT